MTLNSRQRLGNLAEDQAAAFLRRRGYLILERNATYRIGEVDIIARDGDTLVFVEVRARTHADPVHPAATVDRRKQRQIVRTAMAYCQHHDITDTMIRFDVLAVTGKPERIEHFENAFEAGR